MPRHFPDRRCQTADLKEGKGLRFENAAGVLTIGAKAQRYCAAWATVEEPDAAWIKVGATRTVDGATPTVEAAFRSGL